MNGNRSDREARTTASQCAEFVKSGRLYRRARLVSSLRSISRRQAHCDANYGACCRVSARHSLTSSSSPRINEYWFRAIMLLLRSRNKIEWVFENLQVYDDVLEWKQCIERVLCRFVMELFNMFVQHGVPVVAELPYYLSDLTTSFCSNPRHNSFIYVFYIPR